MLPHDIDPRVPPPTARLGQLGGTAMGTSWQVRAALPAACDEMALCEALEERLDVVVRQMSPWEHSADVHRFAAAAPQSWVSLSAECFTVLHAALEVAQASDGAFDPTVAPWVRAWGFGPACDAPAPSGGDMQLHDWQGLRLDHGRQRAWQPGALELDLCGIAKGFAVDELSRVLHQRGIDHHLVDIGGELRGAGMRPDGQPWWVQLEPPDALAELPQILIALHGLAIATSGDYRRFRIDADGRRVSHTIDPRHGRPVQHALASVSVLHRSAMWADAWATALMVLGPRDAATLATVRGLAVRLVERPCAAEGPWREWLSPALRALQDTEVCAAA